MVSVTKLLKSRILFSTAVEIITPPSHGIQTNLHTTFFSSQQSLYPDPSAFENPHITNKFVSTTQGIRVKGLDSAGSGVCNTHQGGMRMARYCLPFAHFSWYKEGWFSHLLSSPAQQAASSFIPREIFDLIQLHSSSFFFIFPPRPLLSNPPWHQSESRLHNTPPQS